MKKKPEKRIRKTARKAAGASKPAAAVSAVARKSTNGRKVLTEEERREAQLNERREIMQQICALYAAEGKYTIESVCDQVGKEYTTILGWMDDHPEFQEMYKKAKLRHFAARHEGLQEKGLNAFERLITGYEYEETVEEYEAVAAAPPAHNGNGHRKNGNGKAAPAGAAPVQVLVKRKVMKKQQAPSPAMVAMAMRNYFGFKDNGDTVAGTTLQQVFIVNGMEIVF